MTAQHYHWITQLQQTVSREPCVLVTLSQIMGSAPRESGCRMIVTADSFSGSIGGGNLEYMAIQQAREGLKLSHVARQQLQPFGLGPALNQCCGGAVSLHFEMLPTGIPDWLSDLNSAVVSNTPAVLAMRVDNEVPQHTVVTKNTGQPQTLPDEVWLEIQGMLNAVSPPLSENPLSENPVSENPASASPIISLESEKAEWWLEWVCDRRPDLYLFGAGHVGQEVAHLLQRLPFRLTWVDQRPDIFPADAAGHGTLNANDPLSVVAQARPDSIFVVMTHSHQLDEAICHAVFQRLDSDWDFRWLGLIGSATKRKRFVHRLKQRGITELQLQRLVCPVGLAGLHGKQPATIALSLLAQLMMGPIEKVPIEKESIEKEH